MSDATVANNLGQRMNHAVDWVIFSLGVMSLSIAIGATVLGKASHVQSDATPQIESRQIAL